MRIINYIDNLEKSELLCDKKQSEDMQKLKLLLSLYVYSIQTSLVKLPEKNNDN